MFAQLFFEFAVRPLQRVKLYENRAIRRMQIAHSGDGPLLQQPQQFSNLLIRSDCELAAWRPGFSPAFLRLLVEVNEQRLITCAFDSRPAAFFGGHVRESITQAPSEKRVEPRVQSLLLWLPR